MPPEILTSFFKPITALAFAGVTYLADSITQEIPGVPSWLTNLGLPIAFLVAVIYALVSIHKALRQSEAGRRDDWKSYTEKLEHMAERGNDTRERLIRAADNQTHEFKSLADQLRSRPCQK
tara:strand:+ start:410 stop:772 length:363 start_codon:yes stop_codon:yes gene_type:complete